MLEQDRGRIEPVFPVASGRLEPTMVPELTKIFGKDDIMQFGGGIHAHPMGTVSGAMACMQAVDASLDSISLGEYAKTHTELKAALDKWG
ncbi:MAG: Ribulose bisphosphate carboxylase [ANME-2 cluster archaeon]|nr:Ribulose bisphosphate carboxylase [ANME-2 cluster archaeon]